jgi:hypothetical protein
VLAARRWRLGARLGVLAALLAVFVAALAVLGPIPQDPRFHLFADQRTCLGIPHFGNVASNGAFALVGIAGLVVVARAGRRGMFAQAADRWCYVVFFAGVAAVSLGSAYYHAAPDTPRLFWDRLPMTVAFMALCAAFLADRIPPLRGARWMLPVLLGIGVASAFYWRWTEGIGAGDLRPYAVVQFFPMLALPLVCLMFPPGRVTSGTPLAWLMAWYGAAMLCEGLDHVIYTALGSAVSGHSIKHLLAAVAPLMVARMLVVAARRPNEESA